MALAASVARAELSAEELAKLAQNPVGNMISVPFQDNVNLNYGPEKSTQNVLKHADRRVLQRGAPRLRAELADSRAGAVHVPEVVPGRRHPPLSSGRGFTREASAT